MWRLYAEYGRRDAPRFVAGVVRIDGRDVRDASLASLRDAVDT